MGQTYPENDEHDDDENDDDDDDEYDENDGDDDDDDDDDDVRALGPTMKEFSSLPNEGRREKKIMH